MRTSILLQIVSSIYRLFMFKTYFLQSVLTYLPIISPLLNLKSLPIRASQPASHRDQDPCQNPLISMKITVNRGLSETNSKRLVVT